MKATIEFFKETVFDNDKDFFEIGEAKEIVEGLIDTYGEIKDEDDSKRVEWLHTELERLKKMEDEALKLYADIIAENITKREKSFQEKDFRLNSEPFRMLNWLCYCADNDKNTYLITDGFGHDESWKEEIPEWYLKEAGNNKHKALEKYFSVMADLKELFNHLSYFTDDISGYFPEERLIIRFINYNIEFNYVVGQGSDFSISIVEKQKPGFYDEHPIKFILDYNDAVKLSKMSTYEQAKYYAEHFLSDKLTSENVDKVMFELGQATAKGGFVNYLNKDNFDKVISEV